jgi:PAS domain S-box-containing protein
MILSVNFLVAALVPVVLFGLVAVHFMAQHIEKEIRDRNCLLAKSLAGEVENFLSEPSSLLEQLERTCDSTRFIARDQIDAFLEAVLKSNDFFETILILDAQGNIQHLAPLRQDLIATNLSGHKFFPATMTQGKPYWSSTFISQQTGQPTLTLTRPLRAGMVVGYLNLSRLGRVIDKVKLGSTGRARIYDQEGTLIADADRSLVAQRWNLKGIEPVRQALAGREGSLIGTLEGEQRLFSTAVVSQTGWPVVVCQTVEEALYPIETMKRLVVVTALGSGVLAIFIALLSRWKALQPLTALAAYTRRVARGDYDLRPLSGTYPEIDALARDYESMIEMVRAREEELRESEAKYRELVQNANSIILRMDPESRVTFINEFAQSFFGFSEEEIIGLSVVGTIVPERETSGRDLGEMIRGICSNPEAYINNVNENMRRNGERVWISWTNRPIFDAEGRSVGILCIGNDITQRRHEEEARKGLVTAIEQARESIMIADFAGKITYVNPAFEQITGYSKEEVLGRSPAILKSDRHDASFYRSIWETVSRGEAWSGRMINRKKDGSLFQEEATVSPIRNEEGVIVSFVAVKRDVTLEVELERQLQHASKMEAVGTLAGGIAHDFNNILQVVLGYGELLLLNRGEGDEGRQETEGIVAAAQRGADLVQQLLAFSRKVESKLCPVDLNREVEQAGKLLQRTIPKMIEVSLDLGESLRFVKADPAQIGQVLMNLGVNARDAMPEGGRLVIQTRNVSLDAEYSRRNLGVKSGDYVMVSVSDTGIGMDPETQEHIFEPFYTTKGAGRGTGLGLAMVYGIVRSHGGHIVCVSEKGCGTTFSIYLPAVEQVDLPGTVTQLRETVQQGQETILLVDDEELIRAFVSKLLENHGYTVLTAEDGMDALEIFRREQGRISLVLLDLIMPRMGGKACLEELLRMDPGLKVLISSGYSQDGGRENCIAAGARAFLTKPYAARELLSTVRRTLDEKC